MSFQKRNDENMVEVVGVKFKKVGKVYYFDPKGEKIDKDTFVIVETARGVEIGFVAVPNKEVSEDKVVFPLKPVMRVATEADLKTVEENKEKAKEALEVCRDKANQHKLEMNLLDAEYTFDRGKILFYFTAEGRVDFRELVKDLASVFKTRIELRQIGVRDEAKIVKGIGVCGREFCCATFLGDFQPVSIKMAKDQNLSINSNKNSGSCGRLMCCLNFEQETYEEIWKKTPRARSIVKTPDGVGTVIDVNPLRQTLRVLLKDSEAVNSYEVKQIKIIKNAEAEIDDKELQELKKLED